MKIRNPNGKLKCFYHSINDKNENFDEQID